MNNVVTWKCQSPKDDKLPSDSIVHTSPGNCSAASNSSGSVMTVSYSKGTRCNTSVLYKPLPLVLIIQILTVNKSRAEEGPVIGMKNVYSFKKLI